MKRLIWMLCIFVIQCNAKIVMAKDQSKALEHICAYSNESVVKFRQKTLQGGHVSSPGFAFDWPVDLCEFWISSLYGHRQGPSGKRMHHGVDMAAVKGTEVKATANGVVSKAQNNVAGYGNLVEIDHGSGFTTRYAHLDKIKAKVGQKISQGDIIGLVGATGNVRGVSDPSHLHFEILKDGKSLDPLKYLYWSEIGFTKR